MYIKMTYLLFFILKLVQNSEKLGLNFRLYNYFRAKPDSRRVENIEFASNIAVMFYLCVLQLGLFFLYSYPVMFIRTQAHFGALSQ